jgi:hypothetical protein
MRSGQINASQLLASFLGSENEKIGQAIAPGDFAGELKKLIPAAASGAGSSAGNAAAKPEKVDAADPGLKASSGKTLAAAENKSSPSASVPERRGVGDSRTKINAIKSKAKKEQGLVVTNPAIAQTVLADLKCPAQTKNACEGMQNKEGMISIKDMKSLLYTQGAIGSEIHAQVPAEHARALLESIGMGSSTNQKEFASGGTLKSSVQIKTEGSYTPEEFRGLLEKVLQQADTTQTDKIRAQLAGPASQPGSVRTAQTGEGPKRGQTESLVETVLPTFISTNHENDSNRELFAGNSNDQTSEAQRAKVIDVRENAQKPVSNNSSSDEQSMAAKVASGGEDHEGAALVTEAAMKGGGTGSSTFPASALPSATQATASIPAKDLDSILKNFDAKILSAGPQQSEANTASTPAPGGPHEALGAQAQNLAPPAKAAEKQANGPRGTSSSSRIVQDITEPTDSPRIKTVAAEFPSSERSFDGNAGRAAVSSPEIQAKVPAPTTGHEKIQEQSAETQQGVKSDAEAGSANQILGNTGEKAVPDAVYMAGKLSNSIEGPDHAADLSTAMQSGDPVSKNEAQALAPKPDPEKIPVAPGETPQGVENDAKAASATQISGDIGGKAVPAAEYTAGKLSGSIEGPDHGAHLSTAMQSGDPVSKNEAQVLAPKPDQEKIPVAPGETPQGVENDAKAASATQISGDIGGKAVPAAEYTAGKLSGSIEAKAEAIVTKTDSEKIQAELRQSPQGVENEAKAASEVVRESPADAVRKIVNEQESPQGPSKLGYSMEDVSSRADPSVFVEGSDPVLSMDVSASAARAIDAPKIVESHTALSGPDTAILSKQIEKQLGSRNSAPESVVFQNSASSLQGSEINLPRMENSAQNGFAYYDPYRSVELAQNAREQVTGSTARQLVLEMEPDELGKISIKVGAKKDAISVEALTQSEPARQALMRHSTELRQDLQDHGLVLDKFMVDVNREKSGGGNYPEENNPKGKNPTVPKTTKIGGVQAAAGPAYIKTTDRQSRISIFA